MNLTRRAALLILFILASFAAPAEAANRVIWKKTKIDELDKSWKVAIEVHLDRAPDVAHMPVRFTFTATSYFERALVDGRKDPVIRQIPLEHQQPIVESVDVGFLDPGTGKTAPRTRFTFQVTRDRGFEAGQYEVEVTDARTGKELGGKTTVTFNGENEIVDRRSMVFDDKPKPKKSDAAQAPKAEEKELTPDDDAFWAGGPRTPDEKTSPLPPPAHLQEKPGCGCRVAGGASPAAAWGLAALALGLFARRRR
jgi:MYXO-CTERM domain-containing protein